MSRRSTAIQEASALAGKAATIANYVKKLETVIKGVTDIQKQWKALKGITTSATPDAGKPVMDRDKFDPAMKPYLNLPAAKQYQKQGHDFFALIQARNAKVLEFTATFIQGELMGATIAQKNDELKRIQSAWAAKQDPALPENRTFMQATYQDIKALLLTNLYYEHHAYNYWSLTTGNFFRRRPDGGTAGRDPSRDPEEDPQLQERAGHTRPAQCCYCPNECRCPSDYCPCPPKGC